MKNAILKRMMPFAVFVLGIAGAFSTVSMQSTSAVDVAPINGWADNFDGGSPCDIPISCDTQVSDFVCRQFGDDGPEVKGKLDNETTSCNRTV